MNKKRTLLTFLMMAAIMSCTTTQMKVEQSEGSKLAQAIETVGKSLQNDPSQFIVTINVMGTSVANSGPGSTGINISPTISGGSGSFTGMVTNMNGATIQVARGNAQLEMRNQVIEAGKQIEAFAGELRKSAPDKSKLQSITSKIQEYKWIPAMILDLLKLGKALIP